jgi:uncharacterized membrane protein YcaP (DUF421 family)
MQQIFFDNWTGLLRTLVVGVFAYFALVAFLRISGKRTLAKLNAFDLVVTVALGSTLASMLLNKQVPLADGVLGFAILIGLQFLVTWSSVRMRWVRRAVRSEPTLLLRRGQMIEPAMRRQRITDGEMLAAIRSGGVATVEDVEAVVLETDGTLSVIARRDDGNAKVTSLRGVNGAQDQQ